MTLTQIKDVLFDLDKETAKFIKKRIEEIEISNTPNLDDFLYHYFCIEVGIYHKVMYNLRQNIEYNNNAYYHNRIMLLPEGFIISNNGMEAYEPKEKEIYFKLLSDLIEYELSKYIKKPNIKLKPIKDIETTEGITEPEKRIHTFAIQERVKKEDYLFTSRDPYADIYIFL